MYPDLREFVRCGENVGKVFYVFIFAETTKKRRYMTVKFLIRKEGRRTVEEAKARVYVRFKDGGRLDVTVQTRLTVNPLWWDEKKEEIKTKVICPVEVRYGVAEHLRSLRNAIETEYEKTDRAKVDKSWLETVYGTPVYNGGGTAPDCGF